MFRIALKDLRLFLSDRRAVVMTFFMPIALISIFAMAFGGARERQARPVTLLVTDLDQTEMSKAIVTELDSIKSIEVTRMPLDSAERMVKTGDESAVLVFKKGFGDAVKYGQPAPIELHFDQLRAAETAILQQALMGNLARIIAGHAAGPIVEEEAPVVQKPKLPEEGGGLIDMKMSPLIEQKESSPGLIQAVAGTAVMMLLFGLVAMGAGLLEEKENGTLKKLLYSPIKPSHILFGKMIASNIVALSQLTVLFIYASFVFHLDLGHNVPALILMMIGTSFACSGFGLFLASVAKSRQQVQMLSSLIVLSMSAVGGSMVPTFLMPAFMQKISMISINYWSIQGFYDIYWRNLEFTDPAFLLRPIMLFGIGIAMMVIGLIFFRRNVLKIS